VCVRVRVRVGVGVGVGVFALNLLPSLCAGASSSYSTGTKICNSRY
jgi:hypothetical protein